MSKFIDGLISEEDRNSVSHTLRTTLGLTPIALGGFAAYQATSGRGLPNPIKRLTRNNLHTELGQEIGGRARRKKRDYVKQSERIRENLQKAIGDSDEIKRIVQKLEGHNALVQSLAVALDDPNLGISESQSKSLKEQLIGALNDSSPENVEEIAERLIRTVTETADPEGLRRFSRYMDEFSGIGGDLVVPDFNVQSTGVAFNPINPGDFSGKEKEMAQTALNRGKRVRKLLGQQFRVEFGYMDDPGIGRTFMARIFSGKGRWQANVPLGSTGGYFRSGESFNTLYKMPKGVINAEVASRMIKNKGMIGVSDLVQGGAFHTVSDYAIGLLEQMTRESESGFVDFNAFKGRMRDMMSTVDRSATSRTMPALAGHVRNQADVKMNVLHIAGLGNLSQNNQHLEFLARLGAMPEFDAGIGAKRLFTGWGNDMQGTIGLMSGSFGAEIMQTYGLSHKELRENFPIAMREHQLTGRTTYFTPNRYRNRAVLSGGVMSGSYTAPVIVDFSASGKAARELADTGLGYTANKIRSYKSFNFGVLDPSKHDILSSRTLEKLRKKGRTIVKGEELRKLKYLGQTADGLKNLPGDPNARAMLLELDRTGSAAGKEMIYLSGVMERDVPLQKLFSLTAKGNVQGVTQDIVDKFISPEVQSMMSKYGINKKDAIVVASDFFKKGAGSHMHYLAGVTKTVAGVHETELAKAASQAGKMAESALGTNTPLSRYVVAATERLKGSGSREVGMLLAGVYHEGINAVNDGKSPMVDPKRLRRFVQKTLGDKAKGALEMMELGQGMMIDSMAGGESVGDWGRGRGGLERRFAKTLHERLIEIGMQTEEASKIVASIYNDKIGFADHFELADGLLAMTKSLVGKRSPASLAREKGFRDITYGQLQEVLASEGSLADILKKEEGLRISFKDAPAFLRRDAKQVFGQGEIVLPGKSMFDSASGTQIRQAGGQSINVENEYGQLVRSLEGRLLKAANNPEGAMESMDAWRKEGIGLFTNVFDRIFGGKLKGSASPRASMYNLTTGTGLLDAQYKKVMEVAELTNMRNVHLNAEGFLSMLADRQSMESTQDLAAKARMFFLSMEEGKGIKFGNKGLMGISGRHPQIGPGNTFITQTFRDVREVSSLGGVDEFFQRISNSSVGQRILGNIKNEKGQRRSIKSFADIARLSNKQQKSFFRDLVSNLNEFTGGGGGGVISVPRLLDSQGLDLGLGAQAFLDQDGDTVFHTLLRSDTGKQLVNQLQERGFMPEDAQFRTFVSQIGGQIKGGIAEYGKNVNMSNLSDLEKKILIELGLSAQTGRLDVRLRPLQNAVMQYGPGGMEQKQARAMLGALQEHVIIKSKKLEHLTRLPEILGDAIDRLMSEGDIGELSRVLREDIFKGQDFAAGQPIKGTAFQAGSNATPEARALISRLGQGADQVSGFTLEGVLKIFQDAASQAISSGTNLQLHAGGWRRRLENDIQDPMGDIMNAIDMQSAAMRGYNQQIDNRAGDVASAFSAFKDSIAKLDRRATLPIALGFAGAVGVGALLGSEGYAPEPLTMPGERVDNRVSEAIASGNIFAQSTATGPSSQQMTNNRAEYDMMSKQILPRDTYVSKPNSYQIRGQVYNDHGLGQVGSYINRISGGGGRGFMSINDNRRPITSAYVDRLMGEY